MRSFLFAKIVAMKRLSRKKIILLIIVTAMVIVGSALLRSPANRLLDNRDRAVINHHALEIEEQIQTKGHQLGAYPSVDTVATLVAQDNSTSPHTGRQYRFIGEQKDLDTLGDSQISYGL